MRSFITKASLILVVLVIIVVSFGIVLQRFAPLHPGDLFFPYQLFAEQEMLRIVRDSDQQSAYLLDILERRVKDLSITSGTKYELGTLEYLGKQLDQATNSISLTLPETNSQLKLRFFLLITHLKDNLDQLTVVPVENQDYYQRFQARILAYLQMAQASGLPKGDIELIFPISLNNQQTGEEPKPAVLLTTGLIPFPPGSMGAEHAFYPLEGQHIYVKCADCHYQGRYVGTPNTCVFCHIIKRPIPHYSGRCELCHSPVSWVDINFNHLEAKATDCISCHFMVKPAGHYSGQCSACHVITAWDIINFNHAVARAVDCIACHKKDEPLNHYAGQCSNCHITTDWMSVSFDHTGFTDCISCHSDLVPINHYPGQCSNCHNTSDWSSVTFDHSGFSDCVLCHSGDAPTNHYDGQCSRCHSTSTWQGAVFNHAGLTDCVSCHAADAPPGHYDGQCSYCHETGGSWTNAHFNHGGFSDCTACHAGDAPSNHYPGQCSSCHSTDSWLGAHFNHDGFTDCISCHLGDRPADHDAGQCSDCHNTQGWGDGGGGDDSAPIIIGNANQFPYVSCKECHMQQMTMSVRQDKQ